MSKLFKLKEWLTIAEAAKHLSVAFGEEVTEADILRLGLDRKLILSVNFVNHAYASKGKIVSWLDTDWFISRSITKSDASTNDAEFKSDTNLKSLEAPNKLKDLLSKLTNEERRESNFILRSSMIDENRYLDIQDKVESIRGIWDLMMIGGELLDVEHKFQMLTGGAEVTLENLEGAFVENDGIVCQLMESYDKNPYHKGSAAAGELLEEKILRKNIPNDEANLLREKYRTERDEYKIERKSNAFERDFYPAGGLPADSILVVRTTSLSTLLDSLTEPQSKTDKQLTTNERNTLLVLIAALCNQAKIDYQKPGISSAIALATEQIGAPITDDTIRKILRQISSAVESRSK